jgi:hypothetical protein
MTTATETITGSPVDMLRYQEGLVRTGQYESIGRMMKMSIGDSGRFKPPVQDALFEKFGRFIDFHRCMLPLALSRDNSQLLVTAKLLRVTCPHCAGRGQCTQFLSGGATTTICPVCEKPFSMQPEVKLPDLPDPNWVPEPFTQSEIEGGPRDPKKIFPRMVPQYLANRCEKDGSQPALLERTDFMLFQPVVRIAFQATVREEPTAAAGLIDIVPDARGQECCFLVNYRTGECHFYGGRFVITVRK